MPRNHGRIIRCASFLLATAILLCPPISAGCGPKSIFVQGRVENAHAESSVTVELMYEHGQVGESDRLLLDGPSFRTRITFSSQSRSVDLMGHALGKCARKPSRVIVVLMDGDQEIDRVTLRVPQDFTLADSSELATRQDVILNGVK
jgi:hypothetical protein